jgi:hypothetical protein
MNHDPTHVEQAHGTHAPAPAAGTAPFPPEEVAMLHEADKKAARNIVVLMISIFILGLAGYIAVAAVCA